MKFGLKPTIIAIGTASVCLLALALAIGQAGQEQRPQMAEEVFKNVQILKGIPVDEFMDTMGMFAAATGMNCVDCHVGDAGGDWAKYATDTAFKQTTRRMVTMVNTLNQGSFGGRPLVTCFTCHRGLRAHATLP